MQLIKYIHGVDIKNELDEGAVLLVVNSTLSLVQVEK